ncbi:MAG: hypothetical protein Ct9H90mP16_12680 [Candidatus Poseidoniales archaeon]|nr:MAG: hypothetical protein Ct9H90mP16_12680 [Candidatus Poseidoniales archaeon]
MAPSFLRFGSYQIHALKGDFDVLRTLVDYTVKHHFPEHCTDSDEGLLEWLKQVADETARMISHWMRVGFVHGVMNTDNMSIHGLTIDYGPYGWLEDFNPDWTPIPPMRVESGTDLVTRPKLGNGILLVYWRLLVH